MNAEQFHGNCIPEPNSGCLLWEGCVNPRGYGVVRWNGKATLAHRVAYTLARCEPGENAVCHRCDNPSCVNPAHLFMATQAENVRDMDAKGRRRTVARRGAEHPNAKLSADAVQTIRTSGKPAAELAADFGVTPEQVRNVRRGAQRRAG